AARPRAPLTLSSAETHHIGLKRTTHRDQTRHTPDQTRHTPDQTRHTPGETRHTPGEVGYTARLRDFCRGRPALWARGDRAGTDPADHRAAAGRRGGLAGHRGEAGRGQHPGGRATWTGRRAGRPGGGGPPGTPRPPAP